jgi:hypothetical protein
MEAKPPEFPSIEIRPGRVREEMLRLPQTRRGPISGKLGQPNHQSRAAETHIDGISRPGRIDP